jgi:hypothetical protein
VLAATAEADKSVAAALAALEDGAAIPKNDPKDETIDETKDENGETVLPAQILRAVEAR